MLSKQTYFKLAQLKLKFGLDFKSGMVIQGCVWRRREGRRSVRAEAKIQEMDEQDREKRRVGEKRKETRDKKQETRERKKGEEA